MKRSLIFLLAMLGASATSAQFIEKPVVPSNLEPLVRELLQVTHAEKRVASAMRSVLAFQNFTSPAGIPVEAMLDDKATGDALNKVQKQQNAYFKQLGDRILDNAKLEEAAWYVYAPLYGEGWSADELQRMIDFYRTPLGQKMAERDSQFHLWEQIRTVEFFGDRIRTSRKQIEREAMLKTNPARVAADDMRMFSIEVEQYAYEHDETYPTETDPAKLQKLVGPPEYNYVDPWGTPFRFVFSADHKHYRIISAGSDRKFDSYDAPWGAKPRVDQTPGVDIVFEDGTFVLYPPGATDQKR